MLDAMAPSQLIPPPDLAPPSIAVLDVSDRIRLWAEMVDEGDRFLFQGFLDRHGSEAAARQAFLDWLSRREVDSTAAKFRMLKGGRAVATGRPHGQ
jgi:hypothetical protein